MVFAQTPLSGWGGVKLGEFDQRAWGVGAFEYGSDAVSQRFVDDVSVLWDPPDISHATRSERLSGWRSEAHLTRVRATPRGCPPVVCTTPLVYGRA